MLEGWSVCVEDGRMLNPGVVEAETRWDEVD